MTPIIFSLYGDKSLVQAIKGYCQYDLGEIVSHKFPDEETSIRIISDVKNREVIFIESLDRPNNKLLPLIFSAKTAKELGAKKVGLVAPYLPYMRQDKQFNPGEGITSNYFASLISNYFNWLMTIDPHLHRHHSLSEIYTIPTLVLHAAEPISTWIKTHIEKPLIIGPDNESKQWVSDIAQNIHAAFVILEKNRKGDASVEISIPHIEKFIDCTPILVDDIISTGRTMIETIKHLKKLSMKKPICIGVHAIFSDYAYNDLSQVGAERVISCNSIKHTSNEIDLSLLIAKALRCNKTKDNFRAP